MRSVSGEPANPPSRNPKKKVKDPLPLLGGPTSLRQRATLPRTSAILCAYRRGGISDWRSTLRVPTRAQAPRPERARSPHRQDTPSAPHPSAQVAHAPTSPVRRAEDRARSSRPPCHPRSAWRPATGSDCRAVPDRGVGGLHAFGPAIARRRWRASFWRAALRRDSSRRCWRICSGWFAAQRSGSKGSRSVAPALKCSSTSRR